MNNIALVFPGQGSQYVGMTKDLPYKNEPLLHYFDKASNIFGVDFGFLGEILCKQPFLKKGVNTL